MAPAPHMATDRSPASRARSKESAETAELVSITDILRVSFEIYCFTAELRLQYERRRVRGTMRRNGRPSGMGGASGRYL